MIDFIGLSAKPVNIPYRHFGAPIYVFGMTNENSRFSSVIMTPPIINP